MLSTLTGLTLDITPEAEQTVSNYNMQSGGNSKPVAMLNVLYVSAYEPTQQHGGYRFGAIPSAYSPLYFLLCICLLWDFNISLERIVNLKFGTCDRFLIYLVEWSV